MAGREIYGRWYRVNEAFGDLLKPGDFVIATAMDTFHRLRDGVESLHVDEQTHAAFMATDMSESLSWPLIQRLLSNIYYENNNDIEAEDPGVAYKASGTDAMTLAMVASQPDPVLPTESFAALKEVTASWAVSERTMHAEIEPEAFNKLADAFALDLEMRALTLHASRPGF